MESLTNEMDCPYCSTTNGAVVTTNITGETIGCKFCGYHRLMCISNLDKREADPLSWKPEFEVHELKNPLGAYEVRYKNGTGEWGSFFEECNEQELMDEVNKYQDEIESATTSKYINGEVITNKII